VPILERALRERIWDLMTCHLKDQRQTWDMRSSGDYVQRTGGEVGVQVAFMNQAKLRSTALNEGEGDVE
jgi:polyphosphate kinase